MLTAAVAGSVFASPPPQHILTAIRNVASVCDGKNFKDIYNITNNITVYILFFGKRPGFFFNESISINMYASFGEKESAPSCLFIYFKKMFFSHHLS